MYRPIAAHGSVVNRRELRNLPTLICKHVPGCEISLSPPCLTRNLPAEKLFLGTGLENVIRRKPKRGGASADLIFAAALRSCATGNMPRSRVSEHVPAQAPTVFSSPGHWQVSEGGREGRLSYRVPAPWQLIPLSPNVPGGEIRFSGEFDAASEEPLGFILRGVAVRRVQRLRHTGSTRLLSCRRNEIPLFQERLLVWGLGVMLNASPRVRQQLLSVLGFSLLADSEPLCLGALGFVVAA